MFLRFRVQDKLKKEVLYIILRHNPLVGGMSRMLFACNILVRLSYTLLWEGCERTGLDAWSVFITLEHIKHGTYIDIVCSESLYTNYIMNSYNNLCVKSKASPI